MGLFDIGCHEAIITFYKNIHDTVITSSWQPMWKPTTVNP